MESLQAGGTTPEIRAPSRFGRRVEASLSVEVAGRSGGFHAQTVDISRTGVLLYVVDEAFVPAADAQNMILYSERVEEEFGEGLEVRLAGDLCFEAEVVRVARQEDSPDGRMLMACRYARMMTDDEWNALGFLDDIDVNVGDGEVDDALASASDSSAANRRDRKRGGMSHAVEILSEYAAYRAVAINLSAEGVLLEMTDPAFFAGPQGAERLQVCTDRLAVQFGSGIRIRFRDVDVAVDAEIVRVGEKKRDDGATVVVGCQFDSPLSSDACRRLGIESPPSGVDSDVDERPQTRVRELLSRARAAGATDLHLKAGSPPRMRVAGRLVELEDEALAAVETEAMALDLMDPRHTTRFGDSGYAQFVLVLPEIGRFRVHLLRQGGCASLAVRCLPTHVPSLAELRVSPDVRSVAAIRSGLVLVSGHARSGRTTLLSSLVDEVNRTRPCHIVTLDHTIEFVHDELAAHITQRDLAEESTSLAMAIRQAQHLDADVVAIGALRNAESLDAALEAAESGRLVLAAVSGGDAGDTMVAMQHLVPEGRRKTLRERFARSLRCVIVVELQHDDNGTPRMVCTAHRHKSGPPA